MDAVLAKSKHAALLARLISNLLQPCKFRDWTRCPSFPSGILGEDAKDAKVVSHATSCGERLFAHRAAGFRACRRTACVVCDSAVTCWLPPPSTQAANLAVYEAPGHVKPGQLPTTEGSTAGRLRTSDFDACACSPRRPWA